MNIPYAGATSGAKARDEIVRILRHFGCDSVGFMDDFSTNELLLQFVWNGKNISLRASAQGWASAWLKQNKYTSRHRGTREDYERKALAQGMIAVNSILRDWIKGQVTAIETGMMTFEHVFFPHMIGHDGRPMIEHALKLLDGPVK